MESSKIKIRLSEQNDDNLIRELVYYEMGMTVANRLAWSLITGRNYWMLKLLYIILISTNMYVGYTASAFCLALTTPGIVWLLVIYKWLPCDFKIFCKEHPNYQSYWNSGKKGSALWVATIGDNVIGCVAVEEVSPTTSEVFWIVVDNRFRGQGIGKRLMHVLMERCKKKGKKDLVLETSNMQWEAQALYRKLGFHWYRVDRAVNLLDHHFFQYKFPEQEPHMSTKSA